MSAPTTSTSTLDPAAAPSGATRSNRGDGRSARAAEARSKRPSREAEERKARMKLSWFAAAERRPMLAQGEARASRAQPWEREAHWNEAPEGRQRLRGSVYRPLRGLAIGWVHVTQ